MDRMRQAAVVTRLTDLLGKQGSWCGETHLQKATYFLQALTRVPISFEFVLYKHGPFSFDLRETIATLRADDLLAIVAREYPYGPSFEATESAERMWKKYPKTLGEYERAIRFVSDALGDKNVIELEQLATALYVREERQRDASSAVKRICELKPHIALEQAKAALLSVDQLKDAWTGKSES